MERINSHPARDFQQELLKEYCSGAVEALAGATSRSEARAVMEQWCARFEVECVSDRVASGARAYLERMIDHRWGPEFNASDR